MPRQPSEFRRMDGAGGVYGLCYDETGALVPCRPNPTSLPKELESLQRASEAKRQLILGNRPCSVSSPCPQGYHCVNGKCEPTVFPTFGTTTPWRRLLP